MELERQRDPLHAVGHWYLLGSCPD